jgi:hypothetical protein
MLDLDSNTITPNGGLRQKEAAEMGLEANLLKEMTLSEVAKSVTSANTGADNMTVTHMRNWMECVRSRQTPNASVKAGYNHSVATLMTTHALHTGKRITFDDKKQDIIVS